ncbi:penicillin-binding protein activator [uncultured Desulfobacter sp.]|uniref:penicillin-binding protein activator n=1 Tax=uncultured Desulfobacter sp. TaxID=240139 RepID=UPI002AAB9DF0|nr:penicillin-binding protein activator [uncultured Desulfobacter sp.]
MIYATHIKFGLFVCLIIALSFFTGCSRKTVPVTLSSDLSQMPVQDTADRQESVEEMIKLAGMLSDQGAVEDALLIYNHAYGLTQRPEAGHDAVFRSAILDDVERLLSTTDPQEIQKFSNIKKLSIPRDIFDYWLGSRLSQRKDYDNAAKVFNAFLENYPDHPRTGQVRQFLADLKTLSFNKKKLGVILPMSGKYKLYGQKAMKGIELALARLSELGIRDLTIVVKDSQSDSAQAALCVDQLGTEKVFSILGPIYVSKQAADKAQALGIPMMALTQQTEFPQYGDYIFSNFITPEMQVQALGAYVFNELGVTSLAVLYPDDKYGEHYMQLFSQMIDQFGGQLTAAQAYDGSAIDFSASIKNLISNTGTEGDKNRMSFNFQALFIPDSVSRINLLLPQLVYYDAQGFTLLGTNLWHSDSFLKETRTYNKNTVICDGYFSGSANPETIWFSKAFQALYQEEPGFLEAIAFDTAQILFMAANADDIDSRQRLKEVLQGQFIFDGATGHTRFDETGTPHKSLFLITVKNNKFVEITR